ncbi:MAG: AMP-binding protein [Actinobacteria bacterium]|nr:AMP-binding protein [Actinomycetota bacterium]
MPGATEPARRRRRGSRLPVPGELERPWLASYPPGVPPSYRHPDVPVTRFLDDAVRDFPEVIAVDADTGKLTYAQLGEAVDALAGALSRRGVSVAARIGLQLGNDVLAPVALLAALRVGAVVVPIAPETPPLEGLDALFTSRPDVSPDVAPLVVADRHRLGRTWRDRLRLRHRRSTAALREGVVEAGELFGEANPAPVQAPLDPGAPALEITLAGEPYVLSHGNLVAASFQARLWVPDEQAGRERLLAGIPVTDPVGVTACVLHAVLSAATLVLCEPLSAGTLGQVTSDRKPTLLYAPASAYAELVHRRDGDELTSLRACLALGAPLDADTADRFEQAAGGARLRSLYVPSGACLPTHANPIYGRSKRGTIGLPLTDTVAVVVDERARKLARPGRPGRLAVQGPQIPTVAADGGWLITGEWVRGDEDGSFALVDALDGAAAEESA